MWSSAVDMKTWKRCPEGRGWRAASCRTSARRPQVAQHVVGAVRLELTQEGVPPKVWETENSTSSHEGARLAGGVEPAARRGHQRGDELALTSAEVMATGIERGCPEANAQRGLRPTRRRSAPAGDSLPGLPQRRKTSRTS